MITPPSGNITLKHKIRTEARRLRCELTGKKERSDKIAAAVRGLPEYIDAKTILFYVDAGSEVRTRSLIDDVLRHDRRQGRRQGRRAVVPSCEGDELRLFWLEDMAELAPGTLGIEEPLPRFRDLPEKSVGPAEIDLVLVPGVAFDPQGRRIGQGKGYYDRFLATLESRSKLVALAYQCQIFSSIPTDPHDFPIDVVVTEDNIYRRNPES